MRIFKSDKTRIFLLSVAMLLITFSGALAEVQLKEPSTVLHKEHKYSTVSFRNQALSARMDGAIVVPIPPAEIRPCDNSTSTYTMESGTGTGYGEGNTISEAEQSALWDAVEKDAYSQFSCRDCEEGKPCEKRVSSVDSGSAVMSNPSRDCDWDKTKQKWVCEGEVNFQLGDGPDPSAEAGCSNCDR